MAYNLNCAQISKNNVFKAAFNLVLLFIVDTEADCIFCREVN